MAKIYIHSGMNKFQRATEKYRKFISILLGLIYLILGILKLTKSSEYLFFSLYVLLGIGFLALAIFRNRVILKTYLLIDDVKIEYRNSSLRKHTIGWEDIQSIHIQPVSFEIHTKHSDKILVPLDWYDREFVKQVKQKLPEIAKSKSVKIN